MVFKLIDEHKETTFNAENIIDALKYSMDIEKSLYSENGKILYSIYFDYEKNDSLLAEYGVVRDENHQFKYADEGLNKKNTYIYTEVLKDTIENKDYIMINIRDYNIDNLYKPCEKYEEIIDKAKTLQTIFNIPAENILINDKAINNTKFRLSDFTSEFHFADNKHIEINTIDDKNDIIKMSVFVSSYDCMRLGIDSTDLSNHFDVEIVAKLDNKKISDMSLVNSKKNKRIEYTFTDKDVNNIQSFLDKEFEKSKKISKIAINKR